jgi:hypothetical protein
MYAGPLAWRPSVVDVTQTNYDSEGALPAGVSNFTASLYAVARIKGTGILITAPRRRRRRPTWRIKGTGILIAQDQGDGDLDPGSEARAV